MLSNTKVNMLHLVLCSLSPSAFCTNVSVCLNTFPYAAHRAGGERKSEAERAKEKWTREEAASGLAGRARERESHTQLVPLCKHTHSSRSEAASLQCRQAKRIKAFSEKLHFSKSPPPTTRPPPTFPLFLIFSISRRLPPPLPGPPGGGRGGGGYGCNPQPTSVSTKLILFKPQRINPPPCPGCSTALVRRQ